MIKGWKKFVFKREFRFIVHEEEVKLNTNKREMQ